MNVWKIVYTYEYFIIYVCFIWIFFDEVIIINIVENIICGEF